MSVLYNKRYKDKSVLFIGPRHRYNYINFIPQHNIFEKGSWRPVVSNDKNTTVTTGATFYGSFKCDHHAQDFEENWDTFYVTV